MICKIYAIYDLCANTYGEPFVQPCDMSAIRAFAAKFANFDAVRADMSLFCLGEYDTDFGKLIPHYDDDNRVSNYRMCDYDEAVRIIAQMRGELDPTTSQEVDNA